MQITTEGQRLILNGARQFSMKNVRAFAVATAQLEGLKKWRADGSYSLPDTNFNRNILNKYLNLEMDVKAPNVGVDVFSEFAVGRPDFAFKTTPFPGQMAAFEKGKAQDEFALFMEMGTGKTKVAIDLINFWWTVGAIDAVLIIAPKGVHNQWLEDQLPVHSTFDHRSWAWDGSPKGAPEEIFASDTSAMNILSVNYKATTTQRGAKMIERFLRNNPRFAVVVDESHWIKTPSSGRTKAVTEICQKASKRLLLTGTPIAKNLIDFWSQFYAMDPKIIGTEYQSTFKQQYCVMGGFKNRDVVGHKNVEELYRIVDPYVYRQTKEEMGLPPKIYAQRKFDMTISQKKAFNELKRDFITKLDDGTIVTASNAAVLLTRLQQITCGRLHHDKDKFDVLDNPRMNALLDVIGQYPDEAKVIIWCRFNHDCADVLAALGEQAVGYYGPLSDEDRATNKEIFIEDWDVKYFVGSPDTAGTGTDGLQRVCSRAVYYSNSFNSVNRWQSEDRTSRIGMGTNATYVDLIARGSPDLKILRNLRDKKNISDLTLDQIRMMLDETD